MDSGKTRPNVPTATLTLDCRRCVNTTRYFADLRFKVSINFLTAPRRKKSSGVFCRAPRRVCTLERGGQSVSIALMRSGIATICTSHALLCTCAVANHSVFLPQFLLSLCSLGSLLALQFIAAVMIISLNREHRALASSLHGAERTRLPPGDFKTRTAEAWGARLSSTTYRGVAPGRSRGPVECGGCLSPCRHA
jgi:hypothetical protein